MSNEDAAAVLEQIADLMELGEEDSFRVRSYRRAAEAVAGLGEEIEGLHARGELESIPGVGRSLAAQIAELLETGDATHRRELLTRYPESILELLAIPGFGPKSAGLVFRELGIATVEDLERAARTEQLRALKGMGAKSEEKVLRGVALFRQGQARKLLGTALPLAEALVADLRAGAEVDAVEIAGSLRRRRETIGDLDLLATAKDPAAVCAYFAQGKEVVAAGDTKVSVRIPPGINCDLRVVAPETYGAALLYFTGSKQHNIELRERAQQRGLTLNEYGLFVEEGGEKGRMVAGAGEEEVYSALGLAWIPPELREARGEIAAAEAGTLPALVDLPDIRCDLQMHTTGSDGHHSLERMAEACLARGYTHMGVSDHSPSLTVAGGQTAPELEAQIAEVRRLNARFAAEGREFTILAGTEADILSDGRLDIPGGLFSELDFVLGSIHQGFTADADRITGRILAALESGQVDILAHPTGRVLLQREAYGIHLEKVIEAAARRDVALEINASPQRLDLGDAHARLALERGAKLSINTDAHDTGHLEFMTYGVMTARRGWVPPEAVINTWPLTDLRRWLASRRGASPPAPRPPGEGRKAS